MGGEAQLFKQACSYVGVLSNQHLGGLGACPPENSGHFECSAGASGGF